MTELVFFNTVPRDLLQDLQADFPKVNIRQCTSSQDLQAVLPQAEILVTFKFDPALLEQAQQLKWVQALSTGVDTLPVDRFLDRGIILTSTRGIHAGHMSELALMAMLMLARKMHLVFKNQARRVWDQDIPQDETAGKTVGILGLGRIGREVAKKASFLGMRVIGVKNRPQEVAGVSRVFSLK
ncbi:MAG: NAD(P)-dependent oxidoreductase, partial [Thermodesulfobacteriota bacterium]